MLLRQITHIGLLHPSQIVYFVQHPTNGRTVKTRLFMPVCLVLINNLCRHKNLA